MAGNADFALLTGKLSVLNTDHVDLASEAFKDLEGHDSSGRQVVILSVAVHPDFLGRGFTGNIISRENRACIGMIGMHRSSWRRCRSRQDIQDYGGNGL